MKRLYTHACGNTGQCKPVAAFLLGLYNGPRFPFDLTELRRLDEGLFDDCMLLLRMDARLTRQEIHQYLEDGGRKLEQLARDWDIAGAAPAPVVQVPGAFTMRDGDSCQAELAGCWESPGYRSLAIDVKLGPDNTQVQLRFSPRAALRLMAHVQDMNRLAWLDGRRPLDAQGNETRPPWA